MIFTIGYQAMESSQQLVDIAGALHADVIDVRGVPKSRKRGFGTNQIRAALGERYVWRGAQGLGNYGDHVTTQDGIDWLELHYGGERNGLVMCMEDAPGECHRHQLIATQVRSPVIHLWVGGGHVLTATDLESHMRTDEHYSYVSLDKLIVDPSIVAALLAD